MIENPSNNQLFALRKFHIDPRSLFPWDSTNYRIQMVFRIIMSTVYISHRRLKFIFFKDCPTMVPRTRNKSSCMASDYTRRNPYDSQVWYLWWHSSDTVARSWKLGWKKSANCELWRKLLLLLLSVSLDERAWRRRRKKNMAWVDHF